MLAAVEELHDRPDAFARSLVTNRSGGIGVSVNDLGSPYYGAMIKGVETEIEAAGMHLLVATGHADAAKERRAVEVQMDRRPDALILHLEAMGDDEVRDLVRGPVPGDVPGDGPREVLAGTYRFEVGGVDVEVALEGRAVSSTMSP